MIRQPIVVCVGHIDHGKTTLLDWIRHSAVFAGEAGGITQCISCSYVPLDVINKLCGSLLETLKTQLTIPGLLFIDTPGHAAFTNLRKRGGSLADIAILVIDINEGIMPQTVEAIEILRSYKTPFIVAANKVDLIPGWKGQGEGILNAISLQTEGVQKLLDNRLYTLVGKLSEMGIGSERFDRLEDYTRQAAIVPCSAKSGQGVPELLMVLSGLAQRFLESSLKLDVTGPAKATVLEVKRDKGLGTTLDAVVYDGVLAKGDSIIIGSLTKPILTKVKALFLPMPLVDSREKSSKYRPVDRVSAAIGVKISAVGIDDVIAGMPLRGVKGDAGLAEKEIQKEVDEVLIETDKDGIVVKADSLGSLEALTNLLKQKGIKIRKASLGNITRKDLSDAESNFEDHPLEAVILGFNVELAPDAKSASASMHTKVFTHSIIYGLIDDYDAWTKDEQVSTASRELKSLVRPCKIRLLRGYVFRQSNPAIVGVEIIAGVLKTGTPLMKEGREITFVKALQQENESVSEVSEAEQAAASMERVTVGRQILEDDILYSLLSEEHFRKLKQLRHLLTPKEHDLLKEIAEIMRRENPLWGV